jgi:predicted dehydrogenase
MKLVLVGNRGHQEYVFEGLKYLPDVHLAGISTGTPEDDPQELLTMCQQAGHHPVVYKDYLVMLDQVKPDVISIAGPFELHTEMCLQAFQRGIHVYCEKPVAITFNELERLQVAYTRSQVHFQSMMGMRYDLAFYTAWRLVRQGMIGQIRLLNAQKSYKLGLRPAYYHRRDTYGGTIPWVGSHAIDWLYWFCQVPFLSVMAHHSNQANCGFGELETSALCLFTLSSDVFASASIDFLRPEASTTHGDDRLRVVGSAGIVEVRGGAVYLHNQETQGETLLSCTCDRHVFHDFIEQIRGDGDSLISAEDVFVVTEACLRARQSADEKRLIYFGGAQ